MDPNENKPFDYRLLLAFVLMFAIITIYTMFMQPKPPEPIPRETPTTAEQEGTTPSTSPTAEQQPGSTDALVETPLAEESDSIVVADTIVVETPLYIAHFTTRGADIIKYQLKDYHYIAEQETDEMISLIPERARSALRFEFWGQPLQLWRKNFTASAPRISLSNNGDSSSVVFTWLYDNEYEIKKTYIFYGDKYSFDVILDIPQTFPVSIEREYSFGWDAGIEPTEYRKKEDVENIAAVALLGKDVEEVKEIEDGERPKQFGGRVVWAGVRSKYFLNAIIPRNITPEEFIADRDFGMIRDSFDEFKVPYFSSRFAVGISPGRAIQDRYTVYLGPLDYFVVKEYEVGLEGMIHLGFKILIRQFAIMVLWAFRKMFEIIPNYGLVIIIFGFLVKALFHPLTKKSMASMQRMKDMSPKIQKLRDKFKKDPQRLNRETMKLYKEAGFNPISGCLPLLAQMPVFFALYQVLRNSIQMRGAEFVAHIADLSQKDSLYILPIIMTLSFFWQQKMTSTDPKQKALVYIMPLVFGFLFAQSPAGLTLYWTVYNVFSVIEQYLIKRASKKNEHVGDS